MVNKYDKVVRSDPRSPRYFKACDVARIAQNCVEDTGTPEYVVMACVAKRLGYQRVWVEDMLDALHSDEYSIKDEIERFYQETRADITAGSGDGFHWATYGTGLTVILTKIQERLLLSLEKAIAVEAITVLDIPITNYRAWLNWVMWKVVKVFDGVPAGVFAWIADFILKFVLWVGGLLEGLFTIVSLDVDDVLAANRDWCTCEQPESSDFVIDEEAAKQFDKDMTIRKKSDSKGKKPIPLPITGV